MLAGFEGPLGVLEVHVVGRGDVHGADGGVGEQLVERAVDLGDPRPLRQGPGPFGRDVEQAGDFDADPPQGLGVDRADETAANQRHLGAAGQNMRCTHGH